MRRIAGASQLVLLCLAVCGCAQNPLLVENQVKNLEQQQVALAQRNEELQNRASALDRDNQELQSMLSQSQRQSRLLEDQLAAVRDELRNTTQQLAKTEQQAKPAADGANESGRAWTASAKPQAGASISANNSLRASLPAVSIPGIEVRPDGDVVRIELPTARLFSAGSARMLPDANALLDQVIAEIARSYPGHKIGIEGHTDSGPLAPGPWVSHQQLSVGQAMAVYDYLSSRSQISPKQLFVVGHGPNHPVVSNGTSAGRERNRRIELVIYPETAPG